MDRQVVDLDGGAIESVEQGPQGGDATVARDLQRECLVVPARAVEDARGDVELIDVGEPEQDVAAGLNTMTSYVFGVALAEAAWHNWLARHGTTAREWLDESRRMFDTATTEGLERLRAVVANYDGTDPEKVANEDFEYGLERVLDGLQARLDQRT